MIASQISASQYASQAAVQRNVQAEEQNRTRESESLGGAGALAAQNRYQAGFEVLKASFEVSISAGSQPQYLLYRSAVDHIHRSLESELGANAVQNANAAQNPAASSPDNSPEATASRILSFSTGFYEQYAQQHPGEDSEKLAQDFVDVIRRGFEKGFNEAKDILQGLQALNGNVAENVTRTYELVNSGYDQFLASLKPGESASNIQEGA